MTQRCHCEQARFIGATKDSHDGAGRSTQSERMVSKGLLLARHWMPCQGTA